MQAGQVMSHRWFTSLLRQRSLALSILISLLVAPSALASSKPDLWAALRNGTAFAMMRHAIAPGTGDPENFKVGDCSTQRNLSPGGREQASRIGGTFRANGLRDADVFSSQWCRCRDTADLLNLGDVQSLPALNSFFEAMDRRDAQTRNLKRWLLGRKSSRPLVLVTHQVNISALTGRYAGSGETVVAKIDDVGKIAILGTIN